MLKQIKESFSKKIADVKTAEDLEQLRIKYLGRKSELTQTLRGLKDLSIEERREIGPLVQQFKKELEEKIEQKSKEFNPLRQLADPILNPRFIDITKSGKKIPIGHLHPLSKIEEEIRQIFLSLNFSVVEGPEVETEYYNFDALNVPPNHPAREMWDTFWIKQNEKEKKDIKKRLLMRTHTSPMQIRYMEKHNPPFQIIVPGRVFRYEATDASHETNFYQVEGLMVGKDISLANFKFIIEEFFKKFFGESVNQKIKFRYRPSYFPFVEPGVEVDIKFKNKWLEIMGAGMVHRNVFEAVKYNPYEWQGFAFGMSLERLTMIKYNIPDIRLFYSGDLRFIKQF
ncbi:MAG: phenylalanine--tRNA ligase subunit alpha [Patescibacteria group bacterium]